eukprot:3256871-Rhodomonas_salina.1
MHSSQRPTARSLPPSSRTCARVCACGCGWVWVCTHTRAHARALTHHLQRTHKKHNTHNTTTHTQHTHTRCSVTRTHTRTELLSWTAQAWAVLRGVLEPLGGVLAQELEAAFGAEWPEAAGASPPWE